MGDTPAQITDLENVFEKGIEAVLGFGAIVVFIYILFAGFKYITSGGNPEQAAAARRQISYAIGGLIVVAASYLILSIIKAITGADVTNFSIGG